MENDKKHITINIEKLIEKVEITTPPCSECSHLNEHLDKQFENLEGRMIKLLLNVVEKAGEQISDKTIPETKQMDAEQIEEWFNNIMLKVIKNEKLSY